MSAGPCRSCKHGARRQMYATRVRAGVCSLSVGTRRTPGCERPALKTPRYSAGTSATSDLGTLGDPGLSPWGARSNDKSARSDRVILPYREGTNRSTEFLKNTRSLCHPNAPSTADPPPEPPPDSPRLAACSTSDRSPTPPSTAHSPRTDTPARSSPTEHRTTPGSQRAGATPSGAACSSPGLSG